MRTITMNNELWVEVMSDLAVILAEDYGDGLDVVVDENGDEYYTEESQDRFNSYTDEAENIMIRLGFISENREES
jgi:hypothetical protein